MSATLAEPPKGRLQKVDLGSLDTLIQQYDQALESSSEKIASCEKSKDDYVQLRKRLTTLPDKLEYDAMLPLGTRALCPGKIVHTNEIICKLGDNWYIETSAKTATEIVSHRLKKCEEMLSSLLKEEELYRSWREEANRQKAEAIHEGTIEIHEEYDDEKEKQWKVKHRENLRKHHQNLAKERKHKAEESSKENDIWNRLDELELEEELEEAGINLDSLSIEDDENTGETVVTKKSTVVERATNVPQSHVSEPDDNKNFNSPEANECLPLPVNKKSKKVTFSPENQVHSFSDESQNPLKPYIHPNRRKNLNLDSPNSKESTTTTAASPPSSPGVATAACEPLILHFKHSKPDGPTNVESNPEVCDNRIQIVHSPGDILKFFGKNDSSSGSGDNAIATTPSPTSAPKSILKTRRQSWPNNTTEPEPVSPTEDKTMYNHILTNQSSIKMTSTTSTSTKTNPVPSNNVKSKRANKGKVIPPEDEESVKDTVIERKSGIPATTTTVTKPSIFSKKKDDHDDGKPVSLFRQSRLHK